MGQVQAHLAEHGTTWLASHQTAGRGQRGKSWEATAGQNIIMSTVIVPSGLPISNQFHLSVAIALGCLDFFTKHAQHYTSLKWPNDIYWKDRKAGGILIENVVQGNDWKYAIVGIGININQTVFDPSIQNPVSLKQITGVNYNLVDLASELCGYLEIRYQQLINGKAEVLLKEYNQHLYKLNELVTLKKDTAVFEARVLGVNQAGELLIKTGKPTSIPFGGVEWVQ
jgi:BirA family biotin operon repressor/biotin-[acetyl-CoA-carboxylase] ligase